MNMQQVGRAINARNPQATPWLDGVVSMRQRKITKPPKMIQFPRRVVPCPRLGFFCHWLALKEPISKIMSLETNSLF